MLREQGHRAKNLSALAIAALGHVQVYPGLLEGVELTVLGQPSMVVMAPVADDTGVRQDRIGRPSISTVHAPHIPIPQPYFDPFRSRLSRNTQSNGVSADASTVLLAIDI